MSRPPGLIPSRPARPRSLLLPRPRGTHPRRGRLASSPRHRPTGLRRVGLYRRHRRLHHPPLGSGRPPARRRAVQHPRLPHRLRLHLLRRGETLAGPVTTRPESLRGGRPSTAIVGPAIRLQPRRRDRRRRRPSPLRPGRARRLLCRRQGSGHRSDGGSLQQLAPA